MKPIRVLYAEDELFLGKIVRESLEARGFEVIMETDGARVLPAFKKMPPDICVLDVMLPSRNGFELARDIRQLQPEIPIIFLTAKGQTEDVVKGFHAGGNDYVRKPFSMEELIVRMQNALRIRKTEAAEAILTENLQIGLYRFNCNRQTLTLDNEERKLSYRENELLKYLWQHRNHVIDRRELLNTIWGDDSFFNSRNLDVYITKLRSYLKEDEMLELITVKGVGYRFIV